MSAYVFYVGVSGSRAAIVAYRPDGVRRVYGPRDTGESGPNYAAQSAVREIAAIDLADPRATRVVYVKQSTAVQILQRDAMLLLAARHVDMRVAAEHPDVASEMEAAQAIARGSL